MGSLPSEPVYVVVRGERVLQAPLAKAWRCVKNYRAWQRYSSFETVAGEPGEEGEIVRLQSDDADSAFPPYYARTIRIEPESWLIWKTFPDRTSGSPGFFGVVDFRLQGVDERTHLTYSTVYEFELPNATHVEREQFCELQQRNFKKLFESILQRLDTLIEMRH